MNRIDTIETRLKHLESLVLNRDSAESFKALGASVFEGTANLVEEIAFLKMQIENMDIKMDVIRKRLKDTIIRVNEL